MSASFVYRLVCTLLTIIGLAGGVSAAPVKDTSSPGLSLTFQSAGETDARVARLAALYVPKECAPTPFLAPGPFKAVFDADLTMKLRDEIIFGAAGRGAIKLSVNGTTILEKTIDSEAPAPAPLTKLNKGKNRIQIEFTSPPEGDAVFRLYWSSADFLFEPIPPMSFTHNGGEAGLAAAMLLRQGRDLFAGRHCLACHADGDLKKNPPQAEALNPLAMPELSADAPSLAEVGGRLNQAWLANWINNPRALRPMATMPRVFHEQGEGVDPRAADIAAYLATLGAKDDKAPEGNEEAVVAGGRTFAYLRCVACHTLPNAEAVDVENGRIPLHYVKAKFKPGALVDFLKNPTKHYTWIRMPDFRLSDEEANHLAAFLLSREQKSLDQIKGDAQRGQQLLLQSGCLNCHSAGPGLLTTHQAMPIREIKPDRLGGGCLSAMTGKAPDFGFTDAQRGALTAFVGTDRTSLKRDTLGEFAERQIQSLNCVHCHTRDSAEDLWSSVEKEAAELAVPDPNEVEGEEDEKISPDQSEPMLTWAGEKLKPDWTTQLLAGKIDHRLRPWLRPRMPAFPARAFGIAHGLAMEHGFAPITPPAIQQNMALALAGAKLVTKDGGFSCTSCHGIGPAKPMGVFEAPGINLKYVDERINKHYYDRWVMNPMRVHRETKMPAFADKDGKTSIKEFFDGDARQQYDAIYHFILSGRKIEPGQ